MSELPKGWVETTLGEVLEPKGYIRGPFGSALKRGDMEDEGIPVYEQQNAIYNHREFRYFIGEEKYNKLKRFTVQPCDMVISCSGTLGRVTMIQEDDPRGIISQALLILRADIKRVVAIYLKYFLTSKKGYNSMVSRSSGSVQVNLAKRDVIESIPFQLPPLPEQKAIAAVLSAFDDKIELLREQNKTLETLAQTIFKEWFVHFNFPDQNGKPYRDNGGEMVDSELGEIPKGWRVGKLRDIVDIFDSKRIPLSSKERQKRQGIFPYYGATKIMDYVDDYLFDGIYLLFAEDGSVMDDNGYPFLQYVWGKFWVNNHAHILQGKNGFTTEAVYVFFKKRKIASIVNGAVQLKINQTNLLNFELVLPDDEIIDKFNELLNPIFQKIKNNTAQIQTLSKTRDTLLPKLMSGETRVKGFEQ